MNIPKPASYSVNHGTVENTKAMELQALYQVAQLIGSALDLDKALYEIFCILHETLRMERATLVMPDGSGERLVIRASYGLTEEEKRRGVYRVGEGVIGKVFRSSYPFVVPDIHSEPLFLNRTGARAGFNKGEISFIGVPVILMDKTVGVLTVDRLFGAEISFEEDIRFLTVVAMLIGQFLNLHRAIKKKEEMLVAENLSLKEELRNRYSHHQGIIGQSKPMHEVFRSIDKVAPSRATALLLGESGTGKELVARAIHMASPRLERPFIKVNCAALPEALLESELLGHEKGAFTGANALKKGRFELADQGTLFLDEVGELPLPLQAKLLRVLQEEQFERLGGTRTLKVDVRIIAATNRSLEEEVRKGTFRSDLYYRLNVVPVHLPPLRDRREDIPLLLDHFLQSSNTENKREVSLSRETLQFLVNYDWQGNVRELRNLIERLVIMTDRDMVRVSDLPSFMLAEPEVIVKHEVQSESFAPPQVEQLATSGYARLLQGESLEDIERRQVEEALSRHGWVQARAARELGLTQRQIGYRIKKFGLQSPYI
ncbi:MAG: nif-specific transcriptional activator NifA [Desulfobulbaceae bacterium]|nr:nif-specific transcriptional activator NifA [Desulfobulbaceae bacterium]